MSEQQNDHPHRRKNEKKDGNKPQKTRLETAAMVFSTSLQLLSSVALALLLIVVTVSVITAVRQHGSVVEAFVVPEDLSKTGITGQVVASRIRDKLQGMQAESARPANNNSISVVPPDNPIKVTISQAGISIEEISELLNQWLGSQRHVAGEISGSVNRMTAIARVEGDPSTPCQETGDDLNVVLSHIAGCIYSKLDPFRYATYLDRMGREEDAVIDFERLTVGDGAPADRAWAYRELGVIHRSEGSIDDALADFSSALELQPRFALAYRDKIEAETDLAQSGAALRDTKRLVKLLKRNKATDIDSDEARILQGQYESALQDDIGNFAKAARLSRAALRLPSAEDWYVRMKLQHEALSRAADHDRKGLTAALMQLAEFPNLPDVQALIKIGVSLQDWALVKSLGDQLVLPPQCKQAFADDCATIIRDNQGIETCLGLALAYASLAGNTIAPWANKLRSRARALLDVTPSSPDGYSCLVARGKIRALGARSPHDYEAAKYWFSLASAAAPGLPFAYAARAGMYLRQNEPAAAQADLDAAVVRSPHFPDALDMLGELYFRRCDFRTARSYFSQALKAAPHWSRIEAQQKIAASAANGDFSGIRRRGTDCMPKDISGDFRELPSSLDVKESERELELMVDEEAGDKLMPADPAQARAVYERARRDIADSHTDLPWSAQLFVRMARAAYTDHQPTAVVVADLQHAIGLSRPMLQASGNPDVQAVIAAGLSAAVRKMAGNLLRRGHPHEAAELLQEVTPFTSSAALVYLELGEALDADKGQQQPALDAFFEAWTANNGDRTTVGSFLMRKVIAIADENEGRGCWDDAEADYEKLRDSGVLDFMAADALGRAEVYETWSALLGAQQHQIEALEKHDAAQRVELSGDDQTALTAAVSQATAALDGGKPKSCPVQP